MCWAKIVTEFKMWHFISFSNPGPRLFYRIFDLLFVALISHSSPGRTNGSRSGQISTTLVKWVKLHAATASSAIIQRVYVNNRYQSRESKWIIIVSFCNIRTKTKAILMVISIYANYGVLCILVCIALSFHRLLCGGSGLLNERHNAWYGWNTTMTAF